MNILRSILLTAVAICIVTLTSCVDRPRKYIIGVSQCSDDDWRDKLNSELRTMQYINDSIEIHIASADDNDKRQIAQIDSLVRMGVDLLVVSPNQFTTITSTVDKAYDAGIPIILYDRKTNSKKYTAYVGCDNYYIGYSMGRYIARQLGGHGRVAEICGLRNSSPMIERHHGFCDALKDFPDIVITDTAYGNWKQEYASHIMDSLLALKHDFNYVFAHNDRMAYGAYLSAKRHNMDKKVRFTGIDGMSSKGGGMELVRDNVLDASFIYPTRGDEVIALALQILQGREFKRENQLFTSIVTEDNVYLSLMEAKDTEQQKGVLEELHHRVDRYLADYKSQRIFLFVLIVLLLALMAGALWIYRNYTEKAHLTNKLAQNNGELKRLNDEVIDLTRSRMAFFTNISHELRTPLTLIIDPVNNLLEDDSIKGTNRRLLQIVKRNTEQLRQLVDAVMDFRKVQNGKMHLQLEDFDLATSLSQWASDFVPTAERIGVTINVDTSQFTFTSVVADKQKIARIVFNLLSNAVKYTPQGGTICVSLSQPAVGKMLISVSDNGKGISTEDQPRVFDRYYQAKGSANGTGIGLAVVKAFAELHNGTVEVESEPGKGSTFRVILPLLQDGPLISDSAPTAAPAAADITAESAAPSIAGTNKLEKIIGDTSEKPTLLIIDDNKDILTYMREILHGEYAVLEATNGQEGYDIARHEIPDLIVCDVMMPVMDGLEFCSKVKEDGATCHIPVIMLTAKNLEEQRTEGYLHGADSYITKPFSSTVLKARIDNLLHQRTVLRNMFSSEAPDALQQGDKPLDDKDQTFISRLRDVIRKNMGDTEFSVETISSEMNLSRVQLYRKVKAITGVAVVDLIRKARLQRAHTLLERTDKSISEVAYDVGFSSPSYFTKCFKDEYEMLPGDVRTRR